VKKNSHTEHHLSTHQQPANKTLLTILMVFIMLAVVVLAIITIRFNIKKIDTNKDSSPSLFNSIFKEFDKSFSTNNPLINN